MTTILTIDPGQRERVASNRPPTWSFFIALRPPSLNDRLHNSGPTRWRYAKVREEWRGEIWAAARAGAVPKATGPRWLIVRRQYKGREQERDYINLVGGCKALVDALVLEGLLVDDKPSLLVDCYEQERVGKEQQSGVWFEIGDVTPAGVEVDPAQNSASEPAAGVTANPAPRARRTAPRAPAQAGEFQRGAR